jgi:hypothetical protein
MRHTALVLAALALAGAAGLAQAAEQTRTVPPFTSVENSGPISITIEVGPAQSVRATGSDTFIDQLKTEVVDGQLRISMTRHASSMSGDPKVTITMPQLNAFSMAGAGAVNLQHVGGDRLDITFGGAGSLRAEGRVKLLKMNVGGVGEIDTRALQAESADVNVGGVGSVKVTATARLDASVGGIGSLTYYGHPKVVNTSGGGLGSIGKGD